MYLWFPIVTELSTWECYFLLPYLGLTILSISLRFVNYWASYTIISTAIQILLLFFASILLSSILIVNTVPSFGTLNLLTSHFILKNSIFTCKLCSSNHWSSDYLLFFLNFIFLRYLLAAAMINFFSSFFIIT